MKSNAKKGSLLALFYCVLIIIGTFSLVHGWFPQLYRHVFITLGIIAVSLVLIPRFFHSKQFVIALFYAIVVYINYKNGDSYTEGKEILDGLILASCASMAWYFFTKKDIRAQKSLIIASLIILLVDTVGTFTAYMVQPDIVRSLLYEMQETGNHESLIQFYKVGLVEYDVLHGFPVLIPPLIMWLRSENTQLAWKIVSWISLVAIMLVLYAGEATTPFILAIFAIIMSLLIIKGNHKRSMQRLAVSVVLVTPFLLSNTITSSILSGASKLTGGELQKKIETVQKSIDKNRAEGDIDIRYELYSESVRAFVDSPIVGVNDNTKLGGHSALFDRMGAFGIIGVLPWILFVVVFVRYVYRNIPYYAYDFYNIGLFCFIALMVLKNMSYLYTWFSFMVLLPIMLTLNVDKEKLRVK